MIKEVFRSLVGLALAAGVWGCSASPICSDADPDCLTRPAAQDAASAPDAGTLDMTKPSVTCTPPNNNCSGWQGCLPVENQPSDQNVACTAAPIYVRSQRADGAGLGHCLDANKAEIATVSMEAGLWKGCSRGTSYVKVDGNAAFDGAAFIGGKYSRQNNLPGGSTFPQ